MPARPHERRRADLCQLVTQMRDLYSVLGVKRNAGAEEIKAAWRTKAKSVHPDQNRDDPEANQRFTEVGRAYEVLKDPAKRSRYDLQRNKVEALEREQTIMQQRQSAREAAEKAKIAKANAERILAELAQAEAEKAKADKQAQAAQAAQAKSEKPQPDATPSPAPAQGQAQAQAQAQEQPQSTPNGPGESPEDLVSRIFGNTPEAAAAAETLRREVEADAERAENDQSSGSARPASILAPIELLSSFVRRIRGIQPPPEKAPDLVVEATVTIDDLLAEKSVPITLSDGRELRVPLEGGVTQGHVVRLKGQGLKLQGMGRGDVAVTVRVAKDEKFTVDGYDLKTVLPITLEDAVLGCDAKVEAPNGPLDITVPAWSSSDQVIRIDDLGLPNGEGGRGALAVELRVMLWEKPDDKVTDLMRVMREGLFL